MSRILVTGASGFIGRHCLPYLTEQGFQVHGLARRPPKAPIASSVIWHDQNLLRPGASDEIIRRVQPDYLLHLAWHTIPGQYWKAPQNVQWVRASLELLWAFEANKGKRVVMAGTCAEYQQNAGECFEERTPLVPDTLYGTCKHGLERILQGFSRQTGLSSAWGRVFFLFGPFEHPSRVVAYVVRSLLQGKTALCSNGEQLLDFLYVKDVASAFVSLLMGECQGAANIGSGRPIALSDVLQEIGRQIGRPELIRLGAIQAGTGTRSLWANTQRLSREAGWRPNYELERGIEQTIEWWRHSPDIQAAEQIGQSDR